MRYIRVISRQSDGSICGIHEIPGDRYSWRYWWPVVRDTYDNNGERPARFDIERAD